MQKIKLSIVAIGILTAGFFSAFASQAAITPLSVAIVPPVQFPPEGYSITGARLSLLWGQHNDVYGIDVGLLGNITNQDFVGIAVAGGFNATHGTTRILGLQLAGVGNFNTNKTSVYGIQAAIVSNYNSAESQIYGLQLSLLNMSEFTTVYGAQVGIYNRAKVVRGLQIGLVNIASNLYGVQIGLVNYNGGGPFKISPIINIGF